jgi:predicted glycosyltransferase involved in capsule biosynthesis
MFWRRRKPLVSILVPFRADDEHRQRNWDWLRQYWESHMPLDFEIVMGKDRRYPFSKTAAVNDAARKSRGRIFVILDADAFLDIDHILMAVYRIQKAEREGHRLWFVPYRRLFRLTERATERLLARSPEDPFIYFAHTDVHSQEGSHHGRRFGAMAQVMPREAFYAAGGMDPRFRGWGGEDVSFVRAVDTMWAKHKTIDGAVFHLHHEKLGTDWRTRVWRGQRTPRINENLASRYDRANNQFEAMGDLIAEFAKRWYRFW